MWLRALKVGVCNSSAVLVFVGIGCRGVQQLLVWQVLWGEGAMGNLLYENREDYSIGRVRTQRAAEKRLSKLEVLFQDMRCGTLSFKEKDLFAIPLPCS